MIRAFIVAVVLLFVVFPLVLLALAAVSLYAMLYRQSKPFAPVRR